MAVNESGVEVGVFKKRGQGRHAPIRLAVRQLAPRRRQRRHFLLAASARADATGGADSTMTEREEREEGRKAGPSRRRPAPVQLLASCQWPNSCFTVQHAEHIGRPCSTAAASLALDVLCRLPPEWPGEACGGPGPIGNWRPHPAKWGGSAADAGGRGIQGGLRGRGKLILEIAPESGTIAPGVSPDDTLGSCTGCARPERRFTATAALTRRSELGPSRLLRSAPSVRLRQQVRPWHAPGASTQPVRGLQASVCTFVGVHELHHARLFCVSSSAWHVCPSKT